MRNERLEKAIERWLNFVMELQLNGQITQATYDKLTLELIQLKTGTNKS